MTQVTANTKIQKYKIQKYTANNELLSSSTPNTTAPGWNKFSAIAEVKQSKGWKKECRQNNFEIMIALSG
jgi:hypothetical protein